MKDELRLRELFEFSTGFKPIYQIQIRGKSIYGDGGWSEAWTTKEQFSTMQECLNDIASYSPKWFDNNQVRITELSTKIIVKSTAPLPSTYAKSEKEGA